MSYSLNARALQHLRRDVLPHLQALGCQSHTLSNGATVLDMGVKAKSGWLAAKHFTETDLSCLGTLQYRTMKIRGHRVPVASVFVDRPNIAELGSHDAFLYVQHHGICRAVSGPIRTIRGLDPFVQTVSYRDAHADVAVCHIQMEPLPDEALLECIAQAV